MSYTPNWCHCETDTNHRFGQDPDCEYYDPTPRPKPVVQTLPHRCSPGCANYVQDEK